MNNHPDGNAIAVHPGLAIPRNEIWFEFRHATGPGGQNVNKVATAAVLCFHVDGSAVLSPGQKARVRAKLANRINAEGILKIVSEESRSQSGNRVLAAERFAALLREALRPVKPRRPTRPTRSSVEHRLQNKRLAAAKKSLRRKPDEE